ncbi:MAG: phosphoribosyltransferase family protein [Kiritimatiellaeota bacterium]|nr:phosphoribosyltransferase family protein [Kiritimatiellota bacterium]
MLFSDRAEAADQLADKLERYRGKRPLVLGIPRGGIVLAARLAARLAGDVDVVLTHKLGAPGEPEVAIGAIDESGQIFLNDPHWRHEAPAYLEREAADQLAELHRRRQLFSAGRAAHAPAGRIVIVTDDGLATGATMFAALHVLRSRQPARLIVAVPVAPPIGSPAGVRSKEMTLSVFFHGHSATAPSRTT